MKTTASGLIVPRGTLSTLGPTAEESLDRHFEGMRKLEHHFPNLVRLSIDLANILLRMAARRSMGPQSVILAPPLWHKTGQIVVKVGFDPEAVKPIITGEELETYNTLQRIGEAMPQVPDMAMAVAFQLVPLINAKRIRPEAIMFSKPKVFSDESAITFKVALNSKGLALPSDVPI